MMNKTRIEALSDGVFAIVMTLLVFDIKVPHYSTNLGSRELFDHLMSMWPLFRNFYVSFAILGMYWVTHHALFHNFAKHASRPVTYLNVFFLCLICLVPFSTNLIGQYPLNETAVAVYGINVIVIGAVQYIMFLMTINDAQSCHEAITDHLRFQATIRMLMPPIFAVFGIVAGLYHSNLSFVFFAIPVIINIIPGMLNLLERIFGGASNATKF